MSQSDVLLVMNNRDDSETAQEIIDLLADARQSLESAAMRAMPSQARKNVITSLAEIQSAICHIIYTVEQECSHS